MLAQQEAAGRGARGGSNNLGGFANPKSFATMQTAMYYIAGSPQVYDSSNPRHTPGGLNYIGAVNDQKLCSTCVSEAITKAVQISLAATLRNSSGQFAVSPQAFYYCAPPGGRSCKTGWDIPEALKALTENPQWVLPSSCFNTAKLLKGQDEADVGEWSSICAAAAAAAATPTCKDITREQPLFRCSFKSLSSFYQIQQHIRAHGAVVTRMLVNNDFEVQFNASARNKRGLLLLPYRYNITAKPSFAHAALITGYDNSNFTWSVLNSWGRGGDPGQLRSSGVTGDGLFRMQMGLAGVGTPDATYAVSCYPAEGTPLHPNHEQPWARSRRRPLTPESREVLLSNTCYRYTVQEGDTVASIVDHFGLGMRQFVQDKANLRTDVRCTMANYAACAQPGVVGCSLTYQDVNVTSALKAGQQVRVCNQGWSSFAEFDRVAFINGSILAQAPMQEAQAMGLLQVLRAVDSTITASWALQYFVCSMSTGIPIPIHTPNKKSLECWSKQSGWWFVRAERDPEQPYSPKELSTPVSVATITQPDHRSTANPAIVAGKTH
ncbi:hypothetical protein OEZ85_001490 [Tetradesmus obliquus]|uniref:Peptidase C1A papain C-terminal domain-containing protein n=1 Tax=Tetradesmus obliquus TaxID=3088 RepID=A0ABY8UP31_TETOB|nr:hypothetical protein OEZ85_001490 [Tetradesmus obliquus]